MVQNLWAESETPVERRFSPNFPRPFSASRIFEPSNLLKIGWKVATVATVVAWEKAFGLKRLRGWFGLIWGELVAASKVPSFLWRIAACGWSRQKGNLVMQTHLTVMRSVTFDTTTSLCVFLGRRPIDVIFHFLFLLLSGKYIPSAFPFGVLHQYQGKK